MIFIDLAYQKWYIYNVESLKGLVLTVRFYQSANGNEPVRDWLKSLSKENRKTIGEDIKTVQFGWPIGMPVVEKLGSGLWQVRSHIKDGISRVLFTTRGNAMILLHGFIKKTPRTPEDDLLVARRRKRNLLMIGGL
jgi:phage-related protein